MGIWFANSVHEGPGMATTEGTLREESGPWQEGAPAGKGAQGIVDEKDRDKPILYYRIHCA